MKTGDKNHANLWNAINEYTIACGGEPAKLVYANAKRQGAVARIEAVMSTILRERKPPRDDGPGYTFADLKAALDKLTPEQLAYPALWFGDEKGGRIHHLHVETQDHINPSGDMAEPVSQYLNADGTPTQDAIDCDMTAEDIAAEPRCAVVGQPFLTEFGPSVFR